MKVCIECNKQKKYNHFLKNGDKCKNCRNKCEHGSRKYRCNQCGNGCCEHGRDKYCCKECGTGYCKHNKRIRDCKYCGGNSLCEHERKKGICRDCGTGLCEHDRNKNACRDCGTGICVHGEWKQNCMECNDKILCSHNIKKRNCKECSHLYCKHKILKSRCKECGGSGFCIHNNLKYQCKICDLPSYLRNIINCRIRQSIKSENKTQHTIEYLGCSLIEYKRHIEKMFKKDMSWDNIGVLWHIDHIIPIKYRENNIKPSIEEQIKRLHYANTQPLYAIDNLRKGNRFVG